MTEGRSSNQTMGKAPDVSFKAKMTARSYVPNCVRVCIGTVPWLRREEGDSTSSSSSTSPSSTDVVTSSSSPSVAQTSSSSSSGVDDDDAASSNKQLGIFAARTATSGEVVWMEQATVFFSAPSVLGKLGGWAYVDANPGITRQQYAYAVLARNMVCISSHKIPTMWQRSSPVPIEAWTAIARHLECENMQSNTVDCLYQMLGLVYTYARPVTCQWSRALLGYTMHAVGGIFNHACAPAHNCWAHYDEKGALIVRALRDIAADEELLVSYSDHTHWCESAAHRAPFLKNLLSSPCECVECTSDRGVTVSTWPEESVLFYVNALSAVPVTERLLAAAWVLFTDRDLVGSAPLKTMSLIANLGEQLWSEPLNVAQITGQPHLRALLSYWFEIVHSLLRSFLIVHNDPNSNSMLTNVDMSRFIPTMLPALCAPLLACRHLDPSTIGCRVRSDDFAFMLMHYVVFWRVDDLLLALYLPTHHGAAAYLNNTLADYQHKYNAAASTEVDLRERTREVASANSHKQPQVATSSHK